LVFGIYGLIVLQLVKVRSIQLHAHLLTLGLEFVVQDDAADWEKESAFMAEIYSNSYINIAASNASHCGAGFLGPRRMPMTERIEIRDDEGSLELYFVAQQTRNYVRPSE
jgi:hypothetical protein